MMEWFFTAPYEKTAVRRGDPLGMRAGAEDMAERLAPGLSNRTMDGRWLSIMCWALQQADAAWRILGAPTVDGHGVTGEAAREFYSYLRPLELLWLARTVKNTGDNGKGRQLPGIRAVRRWLDGNHGHERFGFYPDSYSRYRFTGVYSAYRVALRTLPGLTADGNGWQVGPLGREFAALVSGEVRCSPTHSRRRGKRPTPEQYWQQRFYWNDGPFDFLPTIISRPRRLVGPEKRLLERAVFLRSKAGDGDCRGSIRRRAVVEAAAKSSATTRHGLFADIARTLGGTKPLEEIAMLSPFCELADAGVAAMNACWAAVREGGGAGFMRASDILDSTTVTAALNVLAETASRWESERSGSDPGIAAADALATSVLGAKGDRRRQFLALERHHNRFGGGLKWLALDGDTIKPLAPIRGGDASQYQFRIGALCRLGVQAGIIGAMPDSLRESPELADEGSEEEDT
ncbi:MAG: hypothetical protein KDA96_08175 [Planctomycetaceae bacterium]|nr:hypothetical protein [Planctomycetaceae bacterium]